MPYGRACVRHLNDHAARLYVGIRKNLRQGIHWPAGHTYCLQRCDPVVPSRLLQRLRQQRDQFRAMAYT